MIVALRRSNVVLRTTGTVRFNSTKTSATTEVAPKKRASLAQIKKERNKLAASSLKDVFSILSPTGNGDDDEIPQNFDVSEIYADTSSFLKAPYVQQQYILEELKNKYSKMKWTSVPKEVKRMFYFVAYANYGPREGFPKVEENVPPPDLPFKIPSFLYSDDPKSTTRVTQTAPVNLRAAGDARQKQYEKETKMDPLSKTVIFLVIALTIMNFRRDRRVQKSNVAPVNEYEQFVAEKEMERELARKVAEAEIEERLASERAKAKKWYYLWLH
ncbi:unnamed protein product [Kuraishia capsulata CBS 1993]|uniref:Genetic interactor of prohibitin 7, mitochondrial n=1 Tax=Kuraishia capsulata CBS 1993 TaxID=1382522 RepID=W6MJE5_9ASCO|nr:uncharacterized protein KUCA_T00002363001 [Kuraishia capsulata CBS 1993]CDK26391.1 unnamed protein product [Kuraishia capsulata CBS 1993]